MKATCRPEGEAASGTSVGRKHDEMRENDGKDTTEFRLLIRMMFEQGNHQSINEIVIINHKCMCSLITELSAKERKQIKG